MNHARTVHAAAADLGAPFCGVRDPLRRTTVGPENHHQVNCRGCRRIIIATGAPAKLSKTQALFLAGLRQAGGRGQVVGGHGLLMVYGLVRRGLIEVLLEPSGPTSAHVRLLPAGTSCLDRLENRTTAGRKLHVDSSGLFPSDWDFPHPVPREDWGNVTDAEHYELVLGHAPNGFVECLTCRPFVAARLATVSASKAAGST